MDKLNIGVYRQSYNKDAYGNLTFRVSIPSKGTPEFSIMAKTEKGALEALADYLYNELDCDAGEITADD